MFKVKLLSACLITVLLVVRNKRRWIVAFARTFSIRVWSEVCCFAANVSGEFIGPTTTLVDGFHNEPQTGKSPVSVFLLRLSQQSPWLDCV
ncbi:MULTISPECIES: hypothetical protein [unclassified Sporosarcina]|uniref:hypothetical protein n=1 Tax=unclassified Sporosarcina TaxID=2647733 RepID=UPI001181ABE8|nr:MULTISPECIES: hypothetical protein [unclassified Sporosarcina]